MMNDTEPDDCSCLDLGPKRPDSVIERDVGIDETEGRFADVDLVRCTRCRRLWLRYAVEYEAFTASGRWAKAVIDEPTAAKMTPEEAPGYIASAPFRIVGGSYFGTAKRGKGPVAWGP
jgi:hypothetical protein